MERPLRVLIVDDEPAIHRAYRRVLASLPGAVIREAGSNGEAIAVLDVWRPDVITSDYNRPDGNGGALFRWLRARPDLADIPVVVCSGGILGPEAAEDVRAPNVAAILRKPVDPALLRETVLRAAGRSPDGG